MCREKIAGAGARSQELQPLGQVRKTTNPRYVQTSFLGKKGENLLRSRKTIGI